MEQRVPYAGREPSRNAEQKIIYEAKHGSYTMLRHSLIAALGGVLEAVFLEEVLYWVERRTHAGQEPYTYITGKTWGEKYLLSRRDVDRIHRKLDQFDWFSRKSIGLPARMHYSVDLKRFYEWWASSFDVEPIPDPDPGSFEDGEDAENGPQSAPSDQTSLYAPYKLVCAERTNIMNTNTEKDTSLREVQVASAAHSQPVRPPHANGAAVCTEDVADVQEATDEVLPLFASEDNVAQAHTESAKSSSARAKKSRARAKKPTGFVNETTGVSTNDIRAAYYALLEQHEPGAVPNHGETGRSAKNLAQAGWTPEAIERCYADMKREPFYARKHLSLVEIAKQIGARVGSVAPPQTKPAAPKLDGLRNESGKLLVVMRIGLEDRLKFVSDSEVSKNRARAATREDIENAAAQKGLTAKDYMHMALYYDGPLPE